VNYLAWAFFIAGGLYGGIFLMPYKVAEAKPVEVLMLIVFSLVFGAIFGLWLSRTSPRLRSSPLLQIGAFFLISGSLGVILNVGAHIQGFPGLAVMALMSGVGMFTYWFIRGKNHAK
jgi:hypothetical protein